MKLFPHVCLRCWLKQKGKKGREFFCLSSLLKSGGTKSYSLPLSGHNFKKYCNSIEQIVSWWKLILWPSLLHLSVTNFFFSLSSPFTRIHFLPSLIQLVEGLLATLFRMLENISNNSISNCSVSISLQLTLASQPDTHTHINGLCTSGPIEELLNECRMEKVAGKCKLADFLSHWVVTRYEVSGWKLHPTEFCTCPVDGHCHHHHNDYEHGHHQEKHQHVTTLQLAITHRNDRGNKCIRFLLLPLPSYKSFTDWTATNRLWLTTSLRPFFTRLCPFAKWTVLLFLSLPLASFPSSTVKVEVYNRASGLVY